MQLHPTKVFWKENTKMNEAQKQEALMTIRERSGINLDTPDNDWFWGWIEQLSEDQQAAVDNIFDDVVLEAIQYMEEQDD